MPYDMASLDDPDDAHVADFDSHPPVRPQSGLEEMSSEMVEYVADSDASTDDDGAGAYIMPHKNTDIKQEPRSSNGCSNKNQGNAVPMQPSVKLDDMNLDNIAENSDRPHSLVSSYAASRLDYIGSQEPGKLSQAMAVDVVDKLLSENNVVISQETHSGKTQGMTCPPVLAKGIQCLAKWADYRNLVGKTGIFDWVDNDGDGRGSDLLRRRKYSLTERQEGEQVSHCQTSKSRHLRHGTSRVSVDRSNEKEGEDPGNPQITSLSCSPSRVTLHSSISVSKANTENHFKEMNEPWSSRSAEQQLEATDVGAVQDIYDVGPNTQMAAEAMEVLFHGFPANHELEDDTHPATEDSSRGIAMKVFSTVPLPRRACSTNDSECSSTHSKRRKVLRTKFRKSRVKTGNGKLIQGPSGLLNFKKRKASNGGLDRVTKHDIDIGIHPMMPHKAAVKIDSETTGVFSHPKGRRTHLNTSRNIHAREKLNSSLRVELANDVKSFVQHVHNEGLVKSLPEILDKVKRKKRSAFTRFTTQTVGIAFNTRKLLSSPGVITRSSVDSPTYITYSRRKSKGFLVKPGSSEVCPIVATCHNSEVGPTAATGNSPLIDHREPSEKVVLSIHTADFISNAHAVKKNAKLERSFEKNDLKFSLACSASTPSKRVTAISPVCVAKDSSRTTSIKGLRKPSIARELLRLEATEAAPMCLSNISRKRKDMTRVRVVFSSSLADDIIKQQKKILARFGVPIASSISDATHFVADKFARTRNMLEAMAMGKPIVSHLWLESCGQTSYFIDEKNYILRDLRKEKEIGFSMPVSLSRACQCPLFKGKRVFITPNITPDRELVEDLVKATCGQPMGSLRTSDLKNNIVKDLLVISCEEDYAICDPLLQKGAQIFSSELVLNGIVIQKLEFERHRLFS